MVRVPDKPGRIKHSSRYQPGHQKKNIIKINAKASEEELAAAPEGKRAGQALGKAAVKLITGRSPATEGTTPRQRAQNLMQAHGGNKSAAARAAGVHRRVIDRALEGKNIQDHNREKLARAERAARVKPRRAARAAKAITGDRPNKDQRKNGDTQPNSLGFYCRVRVSSKTEDRWIYPGRWNHEGALDDLPQLYEAQGLEGVQERMQDLADTYCEGMEIQEVIEAQY